MGYTGLRGCGFRAAIAVFVGTAAVALNPGEVRAADLADGRGADQTSQTDQAEQRQDGPPAIIMPDWEEPEELPQRAHPYDAVVDDDPTLPPRREGPLDELDKLPPSSIRHDGLVVEAQGGLAGCTGSVCRQGGGHAAQPGARVSGFVGFNMDGIVGLGVSAGYGQKRARVDGNRSLLDIFGISQEDVAGQYMDGLDLGRLAVQGTKLDEYRVGTSFRFHFVRRGRFAAFAGGGFGYRRFRAKYDTPSGSTSLAFHGFDLPVDTGLSVYINHRVSLGLRFDYSHSYYLAAKAKHSDAATEARLELFDEELTRRGSSFAGELPNFWGGSLAFRVTL